MIKLIMNKVKINLNQKKNLIYVKDLNKEIVKLFNFKKKFIYKKIKSKNYDIYEVYKYLKNLEKKIILKIKTTIDFTILTSGIKKIIKYSFKIYF